MNWNGYPLLRLLLPFIFGILLVYNNLVPISFALYSITFPLLFYAIIVFKGKKLFGFRYNFVCGFYLNLLFIFFGIVFTQNHFPYTKSSYFGNNIPKDSYFICQLTEPPLDKEKSIQLTVNNIFAGTKDSLKNCIGKSIIYVKKDTIPLNLKYGDIIVVGNNYTRIAKSGNPYQFDYQQYLKNVGIQYQMYLSKDKIKVLKKNTQISLFSLTYDAQNFLLQILKKNVPGYDEQAVASALLIGVRSDISDELQKAYAGAGAIHVLSVSGLHVGIIFMILNQILLLIPAFRKKNLLKALILLLCIWVFAFISGLSPSVMRAALMISFVIAGSNLNRPTNIFNSIAVSAFFLLFFDPFLLFDVGFQLSYFAVIAIVSIQPYFYRLWVPNNILLDKTWALITVSMAAQIGTLPFALYYFNQFPVLFLFANFIVIPAAFVILILGIVTIVFAWLSPVVNILGIILGFMVYMMNQAILFIEGLPFSVIHDITFDKLQFFIVTILVISVMTLFIEKKKWSVYFSLFSILSLLVSYGFEKDWEQNHKELIFYQSNKNNILTIFEGKRANYLVDSTMESSIDTAAFQIRRHKVMSGVDKFKIIGLYEKDAYYSRDFYRIQQYIFWKGKKIVLISRDWKLPYTKDSFPCDYLIIYGNPYLNFDKVLETFQPKKVVIAASNSIKNTKNWEENLRQKNISCYKIAEEGAFRVFEQ